MKTVENKISNIYKSFVLFNRKIGIKQCKNEPGMALVNTQNVNYDAVMGP